MHRQCTYKGFSPILKDYEVKVQINYSQWQPGGGGGSGGDSENHPGHRSQSWKLHKCNLKTKQDVSLWLLFQHSTYFKLSNTIKVES